MATIGGGTSEFDRILALAQLVTTPEYLDRVKELRELIAESEKKKSEADEAKAKANASSDAIVELEKKHAADVEAFRSERDAQNVDIARRESAVIARSSALSVAEAKLKKDQESHAADKRSWEVAKASLEKQYTDRGAKLVLGEQALEERVRHHEARVAKLNRAISGDE